MHRTLSPLLLLLIALPSFASQASAVAPACHRLMTEAECQTFQQTLTALPNEAERARFHTEHLANMQERESVCACRQPLSSSAAPRRPAPRLARF